MRRRSILVGMVVLCVLCPLRLEAQQSDSSVSDNTNLPAVSPPAPGTVPRLIRFSGTLKDLAGKPLRGPVDIQFAIHKNQADAEPLWQETQTLNLDEQGHYTVLLGATQPEGLPTELFTTGEARWLGVSSGELPEQARVLLVSVPYALKASDADTLGGKPASAFLTVESLGGLSSPSNPGSGSVTGPSAGGGSPSAQTAASNASVQGSGTKNFIPMWTSASTLGNSTMFYSGTNFFVKGFPLVAESLLLGLSGGALGVSGTTVGVSGVVHSPDGIAGYFSNYAGGTILQGVGNLPGPVFAVGGTGEVRAKAYHDLKGHPIVQGARAQASFPSRGGQEDVSINWPQPFADTSYTATCTTEAPSSYAHVSWIEARSPSGMTVLVTAEEAGPCTLHCIAVHD